MFWSNIRVIFPIYNSVHFGSYKNHLISGWVRNSGPVNQTGLAPVLETLTAAYPSATRSRGLRRAPLITDSGSTPASVADLRDPSKRATGRWDIFPFRHFFPLTKVSTTATCRQLAVTLRHHSVIPSAHLLLTPMRFFYPRIHHHRA
jgi:hypothetical protein